MRAIMRKEFGGPEVLDIREIPEPEPKAGHAVIQVKAFGLNSAELHMRKGDWAEIADVSGDRKSTRLNSSHSLLSRMPSSA